MSEVDSPGSALRAGRLAMGASVPEVAKSLKVSWAIIENLEEERFDALPARVFVRSYIRGYANLVGLDPDAMLWAYDQKTASARTTQIESSPFVAIPRVLTAFARDLRMPRRQSWVFGGTVILIMALSGLCLWFIWPSEAPIGSAPAGRPNQVSMGDAAQPVSAADEESFETPVSGGVSASVPNGSPNGSQSDPPTVSVPNGSPDDPADGPVPLSNPLTYTPGDDHVLVFQFTHDSWVHVLDAAGDLLHEDLERAEGELQVRGDAPFTITLGYAPGVQLEYNGEPVMLAQHTQYRIAKLVLGL